MSHIGKLARGLKWYEHNRDLDGNLKPVISEDLDKMIDVNYYLDYVKDKDSKSVNLALYQIYLLAYAAGGVKSKLYRDTKKKLVDGDFPTPKEETKSKEKK